MFFRDGKRRIDFVLAFSEREDKPTKNKDVERESRRREKRELFEKNLAAEGLELEYEDKKVSHAAAAPGGASLYLVGWVGPHTPRR